MSGLLGRDKVKVDAGSKGSAIDVSSLLNAQTSSPEATPTLVLPERAVTYRGSDQVVAVIESQLLPEINRKIEDIDKDIARLAQSPDVTAQLLKVP